ncbi:O-antigen ligase family protein [Micromonospora arborensis]|uniref:O-antigen ligase family protein n=1 Tax=Micromonospora arborensis TaxID=2116518 RepID=UPI00142D2A77|nr:O-antigen ligase family protein [Micromonospora arborensis]
MPSAVGVVFAATLPLLVLRLPLVGIVLVAVLAQEIGPNGRFGALTTFGHQLFLAGKIPAVLPLAVTAVLAAAAQCWPPRHLRLRSTGSVLLGLASALVALAAGSGLVHGQSVFSAVNQNARPFVLLVMGLVLGLSLRMLRDDRRSFAVMIGAGLAALLVGAAVAIRLGEVADDRLSDYFVYYDSALPAIAVAAFGGMLGDRGWRWDWRHMVVAVAGPLLILFSFRRSVWLAAVVVGVVAFVLSWARWRLMLKQLTFAGLMVAVVVLAAPGLAADVGLRSVGSFETSGGDDGTVGGAWVAGSAPTSPATVSGSSPTNPIPSGATEPAGPTPPAAAPRPSPKPPAEQDSAGHQAASTSGHISDLRVGWDHVRANLWTGVGPSSPQLPGLAASASTRVYVHNELLQDWLRYGAAAPVLVFLFLSVAGIAALGRLRDRSSDVVVRAAAAFCLIAPLCVMTAPFLSETSRWPLLIGAAAGIVGQATGKQRGDNVRREEQQRPTDGSTGAIGSSPGLWAPRS